MSKLSFKKRRAQDDGTMVACMYVCGCVYLSMIDIANKGWTIEPLLILFGWHRNEMYQTNIVWLSAI